MRRVYDDALPEDGTRVLVDRLWPRGLTKAQAELSEWCKQVAPSTALRRWYGHDPERFEEFARRYREELTEPERAEALAHLRELATERDADPAHGDQGPRHQCGSGARRAAGLRSVPWTPAPAAPPPWPAAALRRVLPTGGPPLVPPSTGGQPVLSRTRRPGHDRWRRWSAWVDGAGRVGCRTRWPARWARTASGWPRATWPRPGLQVLERNWRCAQGEIDIIALDGDCLVVCEVKTRRGTVVR